MSHPDPLFDPDNAMEDDMDFDSNYDYAAHDDGYYEDMDGDFDSAMRDAGFGTDEDYGSFGDYMEDTPMYDDYYGGE